MSDEKSFWTPPKIASVVVAGIAVVAAAHVDSNSYFHYFVYQLPGFQYLWELVVPPLIDPTLPHRDAPSIVPKAFAVYSALYYLAYNKYMDRVRTIEGQANALITQITASMARDDNTPFQDLARVQHMWCYPKPTFGSPWSVWKCLRAKELIGKKWTEIPIKDCHLPVIEQLKGVVENHKNKLHNSKLSFVILCGADLSNAIMNYSEFNNADLRFTCINGANFDNSDLTSAHFENCLGIDSIFTNSLLTNSRFDGANLLRSKFDNSLLIKCSFIGSDISNSSFLNCKRLTAEQIHKSYKRKNIIIDKYINDELQKSQNDESDIQQYAWHIWKIVFAARKEGRDIKPWWEWFEDYKRDHPEIHWDEPNETDTA